MFGLWSLARGADANWDLLNYHLYNPFAFVNGKLDVDLAPAGLQSYFNPLLDLPYFYLTAHLPARWVGFLFGALHGVVFILVVAIARQVLRDTPPGQRTRDAILIALAGCLTPGFVSELGNTMGDNLTALPVLSALLVLLHARPWLVAHGRTGSGPAVLAGLLAGLATGLKLTNAAFALALCATLLLLPVALSRRAWLGACFGGAVLAGIAATGGFWFAEMAGRFGNPLFPQFTNIFPNPLAATAAVADAHWGPRTVFEAFAWPFVFGLDSHRVTELRIHYLIWPAAYLLFMAWAATAWRRMTAASWTHAPAARMVVAFVGVGYLLWLAVFSIARYLVAAEVLLPLLMFVSLHALLPRPAARRTWLVAIGAITLLMLAGTREDWGHHGWAEPVHRAEVPPLAAPGTTTVLVAPAHTPRAWIATQFPREVAFVHLAPFAKGPAYDMRVREILSARGGPAHLLLEAHVDERQVRTAEQQRQLTWLGITRTARGCRLLGWAVPRLGTRKTVVFPDAASLAATPELRCQLALRPEDHRDRTADNFREQQRGAALLGGIGYRLVPASCTVHQAWIGSGPYPYQWCEVDPQPADTP